ncbi:MAG: ATP-binding cassette domain-containing protein [Deltaproteobacteria bacterium]|nr:ATP-binding cassette domain-containing protein [Deltaproteobacteria bacterium]
MLDVSKINTYYGLSHILFDVSLAVKEREAVALLGRNGAGKTTTFRSIIGLTPPRNGEIRYRGEKIHRHPPYVIARKGIGLVPEDRRIFGDLTVRENLEVAKKPGRSGNESWTVSRVFDVFPQLKEMERRKGGALSGGEQQMLTIARTLMGNPDLLLLDEPTEGLAPLIVQMLGQFVVRIKEEGVTLLFTEQNVRFSLKVSDRAYIIEDGFIKYEGNSKELARDEETLKRFLAV